jgi:hypothetical protein
MMRRCVGDFPLNSLLLLVFVIRTTRMRLRLVIPYIVQSSRLAGLESIAVSLCRGASSVGHPHNATAPTATRQPRPDVRNLARRSRLRRETISDGVVMESDMLAQTAPATVPCVRLRHTVFPIRRKILPRTVTSDGEKRPGTAFQMLH